jgi:Ca2+-transporting ATPase
MMSTCDRFSNRLYIHAKGAPEIILEKCEKILDGESIRTLSLADRKKILQATETYAKSGMRTLAFAYKEIQNFDAKTAEEKLIFTGLVGMIDPPRPEVKESVRLAHEAGIRVVMITGDHAETTKAIGAEVGIVGSVITGEQLEKMSAVELEKIVDRVSIFARVSPLHKVKICEALKKKGNIVAMTGDGVNDAPAIKKADIGIAMGKIGTDVAREASEIVLADDNFASIINAVEEGRTVFINTRRTSFFLVTTGFAEHATIIATMLLNLPLPLLPTQILWLNIVGGGVTDLALSTEQVHEYRLKEKPRKKDENITI